MKTYIYDGSFDGLLCVAVAVFKSKEYADRVFPGEQLYEPVLFDEVENVTTDYDLSERAKVFLSKDLTTFVLAWLYDTDSGHLTDLANCLNEYFRDRNILEHLDKDCVKSVLKYAEKTKNERYKMLEFVRFEELKDGVFLSEITPDADVLFMIGNHFKDRMSADDEWMIYDSRRNKLISHSGGKLNKYDSAELAEKKIFSEKEASYQKLWKVFFDKISIKERENLKLQTQHVPVRYRKNMTEFK